MIKSVEELSPELNPHPLVRTKLGVLEDSEVKVLYPVSAYVRLSTRIGAVAVIVGMREHGCVEPVGQLVVQRTGGPMRYSSSRIAGTAHVREAGLAEQTRAPADDYREACLERNDGIDSPSADQFVRDTIQVVGVFLALAKGQIQNGGDHQALGNVKG